MLIVSYSSQPKHPEGRSLVSIGAAFNHRHQQILNENFGIQLPLIETNRPRVTFEFRLISLLILDEF